MSHRPRALHVAPIMPARSGNGLAMRQGMFLEALSRQFDTDLIVVPVAGPYESPSSLPDALGVRTMGLSVVGRQDTHFSLLARLADPLARVSAFRAYGRSSLAANLSATVLADLKAFVGADHYDIIHLGRSYLTDSLQVLRGRVATVDLDEDECTSYREIASILRAGDPGAALWAEAEADAFSRQIDLTTQRFKRSFISNESEARRLIERHPAIDVEVVRNAVSIPGRVRREHDGATLLFLGSYSYLPNVDAATWFVDTIWPAIRASSRPDLRLLVAGRDAHWVSSLGQRSGVVVWNDVAEVADAFASATVFVAPLRAGAGTRLKVLEAAAYGVPIVSTSVGTRGLPFEHGRDLLVADDESGFAAAVLEALRDRASSERRAASARSLVCQKFDVRHVTAELSSRLRDLSAT
jgi:glycosyltransferase involved in cell wall biosynthesis